MSFAKTLAHFREEAGLSQTDLSFRSGIAVDRLRVWEQDRAMPRVDALLKLALALGVSVNDLVEGISAETPAPQPRKKPRRKKVK